MHLCIDGMNNYQETHQTGCVRLPLKFAQRNSPARSSRAKNWHKTPQVKQSFILSRRFHPQSYRTFRTMMANYIDALGQVDNSQLKETAKVLCTNLLKNQHVLQFKSVGSLHCGPDHRAVITYIVVLDTKNNCEKPPHDQLPLQRIKIVSYKIK